MGGGGSPSCDKRSRGPVKWRFCEETRECDLSGEEPDETIKKVGHLSPYWISSHEFREKKLT